jgi:hypothetical protein
MLPIVVAMDGNSLLGLRLPPAVEYQFAVTARAVVPPDSLVAAFEGRAGTRIVKEDR